MANEAMTDVSAIPICIDLWPRPASRPKISSSVSLFATGSPPGEMYTEAIVQVEHMWTPGDTVKVAFLDGDTGLRRRVADAAEEWTVHANLVLRFVDEVEDSEVRISFEDPRSAWSRIGIDCRRVPPTLPTMNLGLLTAESSDEAVRQLVLHEFGHALGLLHEHQHPALGISWNRPAVYYFFARRPYYWNRDKVNRNIFDVYNRDRTLHSEPDTRSIMMYPISPALTTDGFGVDMNNELSETDKKFVARLYPPGFTAL